MGSKGCLSLCYLMPVQNSKTSENSEFERNHWGHYADDKMAFFNNILALLVTLKYSII